MKPCRGQSRLPCSDTSLPRRLKDTGKKTSALQQRHAEAFLLQLGMPLCSSAKKRTSKES